MYGTKETTELLAGIEVVLVAGKKITADGKVNLSDLPTLVATLQKVDELTKAVQGIEQIPGEIKDLSAEEAQEIIAKLFAVIAAVKAA